MCGFAGLIDPGAGAPGGLERIAAGMADVLSHRGPDSHGTWSDPDAAVALGHRRLAVIDLGPDGHQPMVSRSGRLVIAYNGEVYNFVALRQELEAKGHKFRGHSDTEVVLEAIAEWGVERALNRFVGMFAFALWDRDTRTLTLARDRLGIKPVYWGRAGKAFFFGSELRALTAYPDFDRRIDRDAVALYALRSCIPAPRSVYQHANKLEPGTYLTFVPETNSHSISQYWSLRHTAGHGIEHPFRGTAEDAGAELDHLMGEVVGCREVADVPLGVFLSGGIDSSSVAAFLQTKSGKPVKTFSVGFPDADYDEAPQAAAVARHLGTDHHETYVSDADAQAVVPLLGSLYDEPFADSSQIPTYLISMAARREVTVALSGDGGDEVFGGYNRYLWCDSLARTRDHIPAFLRRAAAGSLVALPPRTWDSLFRSVDPLLPQRIRQRNVGDKLHKLASVLPARTTAELYRGLTSVWPCSDDITGIAEPANLLTDPNMGDEVPDGIPRMMYLDTLGYLPDDILTKVDRASMAVGLEARVPLLDHRLLAFAWSLPLEWKVDGGVGKKILRDVLAKRVPTELTDRPKMGFATPLGDWLRGPLRAWAEDLLDPRRLKNGGLFRAEAVQKAWHQHLSGRYNRGHQLWPVLMFEQWSDHQNETAGGS